MQSGKNAMESAKETAANVAASANSGMEKTKATLQEKVFFCIFNYYYLVFWIIIILFWVRCNLYVA